MTRARTTAIVRDLAGGLLPLLAVTGAVWWRLGVPWSGVASSVAMYGALGILILRHAPRDLPGHGLGPANRVTLRRAGLVLPVAALAMQPAARTDDGLWWIIGLSTLAMLLDGLDGWVARTTGSASAFGARFDMELDAFLLLSLSILTWRSGKVGAWVVLVGALRYLFVAAGWLWPPLRGELPARLRRKMICVVQGIALLVCLGPVIPPGVATASALAALASLIYSFGVDTWWLVRATARDIG